LIIASPVLGPVVAVRAVTHGLSVGPVAWCVTVFSIFLGFFA
jgi:hypothetical protein